MSENRIEQAVSTGIQRVLSGEKIKTVSRELYKDPELAVLIAYEGLRQRIGRRVEKMRLMADTGSMDKLASYCEAGGIPISSVPYLWDKTPSMSLLVKNPHYVIAEPNGKPSYFDLRDSIIADMQVFAPVYPVIARPDHSEPHLLVVDPADAHFGKYATKSETGEDSNLSATEKRFSEGIEGLINKVSGWNFEKIIYVGGNDVLHTDNALNTTTSGTHQDSDGMWHEHYRSAKKATISAIDRLLTIADVHFVFCPSNHDFLSGFFLCDAIMSHYANNKNISFDVDPIHRKYIQYGTSLIGLTHGDGAKEADLPDAMKSEAKQAYAQSTYLYWYVHHIHHKVKTARKGTQSIKLEKDYRDVTVLNTGKALTLSDYCFVEYVRSISGPDRWHYTKAFCHSPKAMEAFIHHPEYGQVDRITHLF